MPFSVCQDQRSGPNTAGGFARSFEVERARSRAVSGQDLYYLIKKAVSIRKHLDKNRKAGTPAKWAQTGRMLGRLGQDKDAKFRLILVESRIHRLARWAFAALQRLAKIKTLLDRSRRWQVLQAGQVPSSDLEVRLCHCFCPGGTCLRHKV